MSTLLTTASTMSMLVSLALGAPDSTKQVIVQMFQWPYTSLATECTQFLGPYGYGYIQVSPPQETITGTEWWTDYQPVSYQINGKRGTRAEFQSMVETCHDAGVNVIVDAVCNHMTGGTGTVGIDGSTYTKYTYEAVPYTASNFHYCEGNGVAGAIDFTNETSTWDCELDGLADLATDTTAVRELLAAYLSDLQDNLGVSGFRLDAAAEQNPADIAAYLSIVGGSHYITQETWLGGTDAVTVGQYIGNGDVMNFVGTADLMRMFQTDGIAYLTEPIPWGTGWGSGYEASDITNIFVADHDTERGTDESLTASSANNAFALANIFLLAWDYGTPTILSGYDFTDYDAGPPADDDGYTYPVTCWVTWRCEHRWQSIANMVGFRNAVQGTAVVNNITSGTNQLAFGRGAVGFVAINNEDSSWTATFTTSLPAGTYCDVIHAQYNTTDPCPITYTVSGGKFTATVAAYDAIALYVGAPSSISSSDTVSVQFVEDATTVYGENIYISGSISALGDWSTTPGDMLLLSSDDYPYWSLAVDIPADTYFEYKFVRLESNGTIEWESDPNRNYTTPAGGSVSLLDIWR